MMWRCPDCKINYPENEINGHRCPAEQHDEAKELWPHKWNEEELSKKDESSES